MCPLALAEEISDTTLSFEGIQVSLSSLTRVINDEIYSRLPTHSPKQSLSIPNTSYYSCTNAMGQVERSIQRLQKKAIYFRLSEVDSDSLLKLLIRPSPGPCGVLLESMLQVGPILLFEVL